MSINRVMQSSGKMKGGFARIEPMSEKPAKSRVVIFTQDSARVINTDHPDVFHGKGHCLINPDLSHVLNTPAYYWKIDQGGIMPMSLEEQRQRDIALAFMPEVELPTKAPDDILKWAVFVAVSVILFFIARLEIQVHSLSHLLGEVIKNQ